MDSINNDLINVLNIAASGVATREATLDAILSCDISNYFFNVASRIGYIGQLVFEADNSNLTVRTIYEFGTSSHLPREVLDMNDFSSIIQDNSRNTGQLRRAFLSLYENEGHSASLLITLKAYQLTQYAVINQAVARMPGAYFEYAQISMTLCQDFYIKGMIDEALAILNKLNTESKSLHDILKEPQTINEFLPDRFAPTPFFTAYPFLPLAGIGVCVGTGLFVMINIDRITQVLC